MLLLGASMSASAADKVAAPPAQASDATSAQALSKPSSKPSDKASATTPAQRPHEAPAAEALDSEFLEYLSTFEGEQEDWTWFADDAARPVKDGKQKQSAAKPAADK